MAVDQTLKSTAITNREASPAVHNDPGSGGQAELKSVFGYFASVPASLSATSIIRLVEVPSNAYVRDVYFESEAQAAGTFDIGVYRNNEDGGAVLDADFFASALAVTSAYAKTNITNESGNNTLDKQNQPLWQALGLSEDPHTTFDIAITVAVAVTTGTGKVGLQVKYVK